MKALTLLLSFAIVATIAVSQRPTAVFPAGAIVEISPEHRKQALRKNRLTLAGIGVQECHNRGKVLHEARRPLRGFLWRTAAQPDASAPCHPPLAGALDLLTIREVADDCTT